LLTDEHAQVLRADGSAIAGLYATGNTTASVMGGAYCGAGATIGPSLTFAYIAARHAVGANA
jgi:3-oxosteroid 1-dehydrogenase